MGLLFRDFTRPYAKSLSIEKKAICVLRPGIRAVSVLTGPIIIAHFSASVKRKIKKIFRRIECPAEIMYTFFFGSWWIDEHCPVGIAPTQFNIVLIRQSEVSTPLSV
jgi:hypothetical protein